jgi:SNF2 family DNA or RNA helicase
MNEQRSTIAQENLSEILEAEDSVGHSLFGGAQQYFTPEWLVDRCNSRLPTRQPTTVLDPQCGDGALIKLGSYGTTRYGIDIDNRLEGVTATQLITANCVKVFEAIDELYPDLTWQCINANPPFGKRWKTARGDVVESTKLTWQWVIRHGMFGYFIASDKTLKELGIDKHKYVTHYEVHDGGDIWRGMRDSLKIGIAFWYKGGSASLTLDINAAWAQVKRVVDQEKVKRPPFNIYLDEQGCLKTYLSVRSEVKLKLNRVAITKLHRVNECHPLTLTTEKETRDLMNELIRCGIYTIQPEALESINQALNEVSSLACPIMPVTDFETVAYADEEEALTCIADGCLEAKAVGSVFAKGERDRGKFHFTKGKSYALTTGNYRFTDSFKRTKVHFDEKNLSMFNRDHDCTLSGQDRYIQIIDDTGKPRRFMDRPQTAGFEYEEKLLWMIFQKPVVKTVADLKPAIIDQNLQVLRSNEMVSGFTYYPGQSRYLGRLAAKDSALCAGATGTGKSLMAITLLGMKSPERALIIAPNATMRSSDNEDDDDIGEEYDVAQWVNELSKFAPYLQIWEIFSYEDYQRICSLNGGVLPPGVYVSYYEAMFINGARETAPASWDDDKLNKTMKAMGFVEFPKPKLDVDEELNKRHWCDQIGHEVNGIRCIMQPCLATRIGHLFDFVALDEAHRACNLGAVTTQMIIRLQPKYRWAFTATPIPNIVSNLFSLMGWLAVPEWYRGDRRNAAWPYSRGELGRFNATFLSVERDLTQEETNRRRDPKWNGKCQKESPVISSPARLLKLLKPTMAYISKEDCNPNYIKPEIIDVRVPLGREQAVLYQYYLDRANIPASNPLTRARKQSAWLRGICADPAHFSHGNASTPKVSSNMNPKVISILELAREILAQDEQVLIINSRIGLSDTIQDKLVDAGIPVARIDSTIAAEQHAHQAGLFKSGKARVMIMGLKCAASHSFDDCYHEIIGSIEYSPGPLNQATGRIDRVTNKRKKKIYCILHSKSIEEIMFDVVAVKDDAATICLKGQRIPRSFKPVDPAELMATAIDAFDMTGTTPEIDCEKKWPELRKLFKTTVSV